MFQTRRQHVKRLHVETGVTKQGQEATKDKRNTKLTGELISKSSNLTAVQAKMLRWGAICEKCKPKHD